MEVDRIEPAKTAMIVVDMQNDFVAPGGDSRMWVDDLERVLAVAWDLMTTEQKFRFREHPDILALVEVAGASPHPL